MPFDTPAHQKRQLFRFDPTVSTGTLLQMGLLAFGAVVGYGAYQADKATDRLEVAQIKKDADQQRTAVKEALGDLKSDVKDIQRTLTKLDQSLAVMQATRATDPPLDARRRP